MKTVSAAAACSVACLIVFCLRVEAQGLPSAILPEASKTVSAHVQMIEGFPNVGIVTGTRAQLVVDTGLGARNGATVMRIVRKLGDRPTLYLTTTHFHPEHAAGDSAFPAGTILVRSAVQQDEMAKNGQDMLTRFAKISPEFAGLLEGATLRAPDVVFDREIQLDLGGGVTAQVMWLGGGHTRGDQLIFVQPDSVLITGDLIQNKAVPAVSADAGALDSWLQVLDRAALLKPRIIMPTHSEPGDGSLIAKDKAFIIDMRARTLALKRQGVPVAEAGKRMTEIFKTNYPDWAGQPQWNTVNAVPGFVQRVYAEAK